LNSPDVFFFCCFTYIDRKGERIGTDTKIAEVASWTYAVLRAILESVPFFLAVETGYQAMRRIVLGFVLMITAPATAQIWTVRVEQPAGMDPRVDEVVQLPIEKLDGKLDGFTVTDLSGRKLPWQVSQGELMFPASSAAGKTSEYRIACCSNLPAPALDNQILVRRMEKDRVELGNSRFRLVLDAAMPAIVEAYSLTAGPQRMLNYVEITPEVPDALEGEIYVPDRRAFGVVQDVEGENNGWSAIGGKGPMTAIDILENGPLRGRLRLTRQEESWEFLWTANSGAVRWKARTGFRFAAVAAKPYLPFDRFLDGADFNWPTGSSEEEPPNHQIGSRNWNKLPGGHVVYYAHRENYGALGIVALDPELVWKGAGSHRVVAEKAGGDTEIALTFPVWRGKDTLLEARQENRRIRHPLLAVVSADIQPETTSARPEALP